MEANRLPNEVSSTPTEPKKHFYNNEFIVPPHTQALKRTYSTPDTIPKFQHSSNSQQETHSSRTSVTNLHHPCELCQSDKNQMSHISRYKVKKDIGSGTFAHVKLVQDGPCLLVLKIMSKSSRESKSVYEIESNILSQLHHKNIVQIKESFQTEDLYCIALEYIQGRELFDIIANDFNSLTMTHIKDYFKQIILGLFFLFLYTRDSNGN